MTCHQEILLDLNADCAEFCTDPDHSNLLATGTYQLDETTSTRHGRLYLYSLLHLPRPQLQQQATLEVPGIFDLQWTKLQTSHRNPCIGVALADGSLRIVTINTGSSGDQQLQQQQQLVGPDADKANSAINAAKQQQEQLQLQGSLLQELCRCQAVNSGMALALDWQQQEQQPQLAAVSSSGGTISIVQVQGSGLQQLIEWAGHDLEAWMASWDKHQYHVLYSGSDDCSFKGWDTRTACSSSSSSSDGGGAAQQTPIFSNRKAHSAGVCCISSHPRRQHVLVTGSYDDCVRLWDMRMMQRPVQTCEVAAGGGVWRLKWHPRDDRLLLAACMYNGFALVQASHDWNSLEVVEEYKGHDSIAYGADWYKGKEQHCTVSAAAAQMTHATAEGQEVEAAAAQLAAVALNEQASMQGQKQDIVATCSFYDRKLHLWSPNHMAAYGSCA